MSTQRSSPKRHFWHAFAQKDDKHAIQRDSNMAKHHGEVMEVQPMAHHTKAVAKGGGQGPIAPRGGRSLPNAAWPFLHRGSGMTTCNDSANKFWPKIVS
jgi:hypothetical protein